jgi:hypothetical protein
MSLFVKPARPSERLYMKDFARSLLRRTTSVTAAALALTAAAAPPALADTTESFTDRTKDAAARVDITRVRGLSTDDLVRVAVKVRGALPRRGRVVITIGDWDQRYTFTAVKDGSHIRRSTRYMSDEGVTSSIPCAWNIRWRTGEDTIKLTVPRDGQGNCLYTDEWTFGTATKVVLTSGDELDRWVKR